MATKKRKTKSKKVTPKNKKKISKKTARKRAPAKKRAAKKASPKKVVAKKKVGAKKTAARKVPARKANKTAAKRKQVETANPAVDSGAFVREGLKSRAGGQSGDLQGLSNIEGADSESVDELIEEGNSFEAGIVQGVEDADEEGEVRTHEMPEDDVPDEYLDKE